MNIAHLLISGRDEGRYGSILPKLMKKDHPLENPNFPLSRKMTQIEIHKNIESKMKDTMKDLKPSPIFQVRKFNKE